MSYIYNQDDKTCYPASALSRHNDMLFIIIISDNPATITNTTFAGAIAVFKEKSKTK